MPLDIGDNTKAVLYKLITVGAVVVVIAIIVNAIFGR